MTGKDDTPRPVDLDNDMLLVGSYANNCTREKLCKMIDNPEELDRLNKHRGTNWNQSRLNAVLKSAIIARTIWISGDPDVGDIWMKLSAVKE